MQRVHSKLTLSFTTTRYFRPLFAKIDATIIICSFLVDALTRGIAEEIGSLIVILRLWRFVKIAEEFSLGANEQMETLQARIETLEQENEALREERHGVAAASGSGPGSAGGGSRRGRRDVEAGVVGDG